MILLIKSVYNTNRKSQWNNCFIISINDIPHARFAVVRFLGRELWNQSDYSISVYLVSVYTNMNTVTVLKTV